MQMSISLCIAIYYMCYICIKWMLMDDNVHISEMSTKDVWCFMLEPFIIWVKLFNRCAAIICALLFIPYNKSNIFNWIKKL
jgi:hypothetical protein